MANLQVGVAGNGTVTVGAGASVHSPASNELTLGTNNAERLRLDSNGDLLLGTTTSAGKLTVDSGTSNTCATFQSSDSGAGINVKDDSARSSIEQNGTTLKISSDTGAEHANSDIRLQVDGSTKLLIDSSGRLLLGTTSNTSPIGWGNNLQVAGTSAVAGVSIRRDSADTGGALLVFGKSRGSLNGSTVVQSGDQIGGMYFAGGDGTDVNSIAAQLSVEVDGTPGSNDMPGRILFKTTADGAASPTERLRITSGGHVIIKNAGVTASTGLLQLNHTDGRKNTLGTHYASNAYDSRIEFGISDGSTGGGTNRVASISYAGISFGTDTASANRLDDYEEGNYTPTFAGGSSGDYSINSSYDNLAYTKIGRQVTVTGRIRMSAKNAASGSYLHMSLPTTSANLSEDMGRVGGLVIVQSSGSAINSFVTHPTTANNSYVQIGIVDGTGFGDANAQFSGDEIVFVSITYQSA